MNDQIINHLQRTYLQEYGFGRHQFESYEDFLRKDIQNVINEESEIKKELGDGKKYRVKLGQIYVDRASRVDELGERKLVKIYPQEARLRNLTYSGVLSVDILEEVYKDNGLVERQVYRKYPLGRIPIMVMSEKCHLNKLSPEQRVVKGESDNECGGYFIIGGQEKILVAQEINNYDTVIITKGKNPKKLGDKLPSKSKLPLYEASMRSMSEETGHSSKTNLYIYRNDEIKIYLPKTKSKSDIQIGIVFRALGYNNFNRFILYNYDPHTFEGKEMERLVEKIHCESSKFGCKCEPESKECPYEGGDDCLCGRDNALKIIGSLSKNPIPPNEKIETAQHIIQSEIFPHLGILRSNEQVAYHLGNLVNKLILTSLHVREPDNIDNLSNKRFNCTGSLLSEVFRTSYKKFIRAFKDKLSDNPSIRLGISRDCDIESDIAKCMRTGDWSIKNSGYVKKGVSQILSRLSTVATISYMYRHMIPNQKDSRNVSMRQIDPSQYGFCCPLETPEGKSSGIVKNFTIFIRISPNVTTSRMIDFIEHVTRISPGVYEGTKVMINGLWFGSCVEPESLVEELRDMRSKKLLKWSISISYDDLENELHICSNGNRILRPLFNTVKLREKITDEVEMNDVSWKALEKTGVIFYVDSKECESYVICPDIGRIDDREWDACEMSGSMMFSISASMIPFVNTIPATRGCYQTNMGKQSMGVYTTSYQLRTDTSVHVMWYPQIPICSTYLSYLAGMYTQPAGVNAIVAVLTYEGWGQEDSVIINRGSLDKGMFISNSIRSKSTSIEINSSCIEEICVPPQNVRSIGKKYFHLDDSGIARIGSVVNRNDVIIGKISTDINSRISSDVSVFIDRNEMGIIDRVFKTTSKDGYLMVTIKIRKLCIPEIGDKVASRYAQKGTMALIVPPEDMPFTQSGMTPDLIMNPHAFPSRMTIGQILECVKGKIGCVKGELQDATSFVSSNTNIVKQLSTGLKELGYHESGKEIMYNGITGEPYYRKCTKKGKFNPVRIFIGPVYYQRLKHLVAPKIHARDEGAKSSSTRQPVGGRSMDGGLKYGCMEKMSSVGTGCSFFTNERLTTMSDNYDVKICPNCHIISNHKDQCHLCQDTPITTKMPYASKILFQMMQALMIQPKFEIER